MFLSAGTRHRIIFKVFENDRLLYTCVWKEYFLSFPVYTWKSNEMF
jgi:hypothetical protein